ncbi:ABC transporter permease [Brevibacterium sp. SMBL_HHYL_HB1]|uniref:ABC transporter permease n=1 Tax=Brevibacterium sp. SMBL_HHYL_HB1 TaxID=2777556 RepID=UPI001BADCE56|nr:ABC transporter permease [Brevibacterium sp. SMBL_HHYL_HB1]QUL78481.1 ABC transporter permease [Brevibacterium sp. SMBL_HHYL_HB1]
MSAELKRSTEPKRSPSRPEDAGVKGAAPGTGRLVGLAKTTGLFLIVAAVVILIWQLLTAGYDDGGLAPTPAASWHRLIEVVSTAFVFRPPNDVGIVFHLIASLRRVLIGFGLAALIAIPLGLVLGSSRTLESALDPIVQVLRPVSPLAWLPIGLAILRDSEATAVFVIFMASLWIILINTIDGVHRIDPAYLDLARTLETTPLRRILRITLPATVPAIVTGLRTSLSTAWLVIIAAEMIVGSRGMGTFVWNEWNAMNIDSIVVAILIIGLVGFLLDRAVSQLHRLVPAA